MRAPSDLALRTPRPDAGSLAQLLAALLWLPQAALLAWAVQRLAAGGGLAGIAGPAVGLLLLGGLRAACEAWGSRRVFQQAREQVLGMRARAAWSLAGLSPLERTRPASGLAASVIVEQAESVLPYLVRWHPARWRVMVVPPVLVAVVASLSWVAALVLLLAAPLIPLFMAIVGWRARAASEAQLQGLGDMNAFLLDRLRGLSTVRALAAVDATALRLRAAAEALRARTMAVLRIAFLSSAVLELFSALGVAMVAVYIGFHLLGVLEFGAWGRRLSLGEALFVLLLAPAFFEPLRDLSAAWHDRAGGEAALAALHQLALGGVTLPGGVPSSAAGEGIAAVAPLPGPPALRIADLHFAQTGEAAGFEGYALRVGAGEHVALVGASGAGKSALLALIAGLVPFTRGHIEIGGVPLTPETADALRARIGWMGQKPHVFAASVQVNVALGRAGADLTRVRSAMRLAALDQVAQAHPGVALGEGGSGLSGGEAVRLALARLGVDERADLLLVDEPTAHLDRETAQQVIDALLQLARGKTLIVATHDPLLVARMQRAVSVDALPLEQAA